jgi:hypothetical protein
MTPTVSLWEIIIEERRNKCLNNFGARLFVISGQMRELFLSKIVSGSLIMQHSSRQCKHYHWIKNRGLPLSITINLTAGVYTITSQRRMNEERSKFHISRLFKQQINLTNNDSAMLIIMIE